MGDVILRRDLEYQNPYQKKIVVYFRKNKKYIDMSVAISLNLINFEILGYKKNQLIYEVTEEFLSQLIRMGYIFKFKNLIDKQKTIHYSAVPNVEGILKVDDMYENIEIEEKKTTINRL